MSKFGFTIEVWQMTAVTNPKIQTNELFIQFADQRFASIRNFSHLNQIIDALNNEKQTTVYFNFLNFDFHTYKIFHQLAILNCYTILFYIASLPVPFFSSISFRNKLVLICNKVHRFRLKHIKQIFLKVFTRLFFEVAKPKLFVVGGSMAYAQAKNINSDGADVLEAHALDYDVYLALRDLEPLQDFPEGYSVFLESDFCFSPDYKTLDFNPVTTPDRYFPYICNFLRHIENERQTKIIICLHPKTYIDLHQYFPGFVLVKGSSAQLIQNAKLVIATYTTAINFAVLFRKPLILVSTDDIDVRYGAYIQATANCLGTKVYNLHSFDVKLDYVVSGVDWHYQDYIHKYIKSNSDDRYLWEIVADFLRNL